MTDRRYSLVTGGNRGIGRATVAAILDESDETRVFLGSRNKGRGDEARAQLVEEESARDGRIDVLQLDVADDKSVSDAAERARSKLDGESLCGIVNNAGVGDRGREIREVLDVNTFGPKRVCDAFLPLMTEEGGRVVNVSSAAGPNFVNDCNAERRELLTDHQITWSQIEAFMNECIKASDKAGDFDSTGIGNGRSYGLSKALLNAYTMLLDRKHPGLIVNACTPGFIETGMTRPMAERRGKEPEEMGMKPPEEGVTAQMFLLFGEPRGSGWYFGSDAKRSPLDRYRSPGDPEYMGD